MQPGVPTLEQLDALMATPFWKHVKQFNQDFITRHEDNLGGYGFRWGEDPMGLWSRRWEYPWCVRQTLAYARDLGRDDLTIVDAGSGVTFFPYLLCEHLPSTKVIASDFEAKYGPMYDKVNETESHDRVSFVQSALQNMPFKDGELDVLTCISVLEHTGDYVRCVEEIARVVKPGGLLVLTFDLSLDPKFPKFELSPASAKTMFAALDEHFEASADSLWQQASVAYDSKGKDLLSTPEMKQRSPQHLPWKYPLIQSFYDLFRGYGWTGGFRSVAPICMAIRRRG